MIAVLDYDAGNLASVKKALDFIGVENKVASSGKELKEAAGLIIPGVGAFGEAKRRLEERGLDNDILSFVKSGKPVLGICLGMQLLFEESEEAPGVKGLALLKGRVLKFSAESGIKIPHVGWNSLKIKPGKSLFNEIDTGVYVYFVHSYYVKSDYEENVAASTEYGTLIHSAAESDNIFACQFHPEKSSETGLKILKNFAEICGRA